MKKNGLISGILGIVAAILYFASMAHYAFPGESARLMACWQGLEHTADPQFPLMAVFARLLGGGNLLAPVCGVLSVIALCHLVASFGAWRVREEKAIPQKETLARIAAVVASVVFMLSPGVRSAATHLEPRLFDFTWALLALALAIPFFRGCPGSGILFPLVFGALTAIGLVDSAIFLAFLPFFVAVVVMVSVRNGRKPYLPLFLFFFAGVLAFFLSLGIFGVDAGVCLGRVAKEFREYRTVSGWLFVTIFATVPFVTAVFSSGKAFGEKSGLVPWLFHGAMTFVSILAIATPLSPSSLMSPFGIAPVATSAFAAAVAGYLAAYWWLNRTALVGLVAGGILALVLAVTSVWNLFAFDGEIGAFADKVARRIVDDLDGRRWLVTDGSLDSHLKLVAAEAGKDINLISLARDLDEDYLAELAELVKREGVGGSKNATLRLSLTLGVLPFVQDWFSSDPSVVKDVAVFGIM